MRREAGANCPGHNPSERGAEHRADEARRGLFLARMYAAREARIAPADDALAKLNAALDAIGTQSRRQTDHRRLFGACALVALLLLLLSPVAHTMIAVSTRNAGRSAVTSSNVAIGGRSALPPVAVAASAGGGVAPTEGGDTTIRAPAINGRAPMAGGSETPLRDLLARAGIYASAPPGGSPGEGHPPQH